MPAKNEGEQGKPWLQGIEETQKTRDAEISFHSSGSHGRSRNRTATIIPHQLVRFRLSTLSTSLWDKSGDEFPKPHRLSK